MQTLNVRVQKHNRAGKATHRYAQAHYFLPYAHYVVSLNEGE